MTKRYPKGSEWRRWDLQIQTILDDGYIELSVYANELKISHPNEWEAFITAVGTEEDVLKYDSKEYFFTDPNDNNRGQPPIKFCIQ